MKYVPVHRHALALACLCLGTASAYATTASGVECFLDWAETQVPALLTPARQPTQTVGTILYRAYPSSGVYVGTDGVSALALGGSLGSNVVKLGTMTDFLSTALAANCGVNELTALNAIETPPVSGISNPDAIEAPPVSGISSPDAIVAPPVSGITSPVVTTFTFPDTGITSEQCYEKNSDTLVSCSDSTAIAKQDGNTGRDATDSNNTDGKLGFSYSRVGTYNLTECVKDNLTGLIWEGKSSNSAATRYSKKTYTNYGDGRAEDASAYVKTVNSERLCGFSDWRLPTVDELLTLVDYSVPYPGPMIDAKWFPNTPASFSYWSSMGFFGDSSRAWGVSFSRGSVDSSVRGSTSRFGGGSAGTNLVRLVR